MSTLFVQVPELCPTVLGLRFRGRLIDSMGHTEMWHMPSQLQGEIICKQIKSNWFMKNASASAHGRDRTEQKPSNRLKAILQNANLGATNLAEK